MSNEALLVVSVLVLYAGLLVWYRLFGERGLYAWTVFSTLAANIEVLILVTAFGMEQTLGNVMFATTFIVTDILSETEGKAASKRAVSIGIATSVTFIAVTQLWLAYTPSANDWAFESVKTLFSNTPRLMLVSLMVYAIAQRFDVWAYHAIWAVTTRARGDKEKGLWIRNNGSTLVSQLLNTVLYSAGAFWGLYPFKTLVSIMASSYIVYVVTSLADTPVVYIARRMHRKRLEAARA